MIPGSSSVEIILHYDDLATEPTGVQWRQRSYFRQSQSPMDDTRIVQRRDQPTLRWSCYWAYWHSMTTTFLLQTVSESNGWDQDRPASRSTYTTMLLLLSLLAFNDDNFLTSDVSEPIGWDQDRPASRSTYTMMLLLQQAYGPSGCYQVQTSRSTP